MTGEEESVLEKFLLHHGESYNDQDFDTCYRQRLEDADSETYYKHTPHLAQVWKNRYSDGFRDGQTYHMLRYHQPVKLTTFPM